MVFIGPLNKHESIMSFIRGKYYGYPECCTNFFVRRFIYSTKYPERADPIDPNHPSLYFIACPEHAKAIIDEKVKWDDLIVERHCGTPCSDSDQDKLYNEVRKKYKRNYKRIWHEMILKWDYEEYLFESKLLLEHYKKYPGKLTEENATKRLEKIKTHYMNKFMDDCREKRGITFEPCCIEYTKNDVLYYDKEAGLTIHKTVPYNVWAVNRMSKHKAGLYSIIHRAIVLKCPKCADEIYPDLFKKYISC